MFSLFKKKKKGDLYDDDVVSVAWTLAIKFLLFLFVNILLIGIAELATSLEDPFAGGGIHMPLEEMARSTVRDVARARRDASALLGLGVGGEGGGGGATRRRRGGDGGERTERSGLGAPRRKVLETVDWKGAEEAFSSVG